MAPNYRKGLLMWAQGKYILAALYILYVSSAFYPFIYPSALYSFICPSTFSVDFDNMAKNGKTFCILHVVSHFIFHSPVNEQQGCDRRLLRS